MGQLRLVHVFRPPVQNGLPMEAPSISGQGADGAILGAQKALRVAGMVPETPIFHWSDIDGDGTWIHRLSSALSDTRCAPTS